MGALFAPRQRANSGQQTVNGLNVQIQNSQDPADYAAEMIRRSGGDAKAAFYLACKEKGIDADDFVRKIQMMQNPQGAFQSMVMSNPKIQTLVSLFSSVK